MAFLCVQPRVRPERRDECLGILRRARELEPAFYISDGACGIPASAQSLAINLTAVTPGSDGFLQIYPGSSTAPVVSAINFASGLTRNNNGLI